MQYVLRWDNYLNQITDAFGSLKNEEDLVDVTISCEGKKLKAHKMLLSACSPYFRDVFKDNPCQHPVIVFRNFKFVDLQAIVDFMYKGEVDVTQENLETFLETAELLEVKGLTENSAKIPNLGEVEEDLNSEAPKTFVSNIDLLPGQPSTLPVTSVKQQLFPSPKTSRNSATKKRKSNLGFAQSSEKKTKSTESPISTMPKIEPEDIEDLVFDVEDMDDSHSTSTDVSQQPPGAEGSNEDLNQLRKGLIHVPEPGSSLELAADMMQTQEFVVCDPENKSSDENYILIEEKEDSKVSKTGLPEADKGVKTSSNKNIQESAEPLISPNSKTGDAKELANDKAVEKALKTKSLNLPKGLLVTMKEVHAEECAALRSEEAKTLIQEGSIHNQEQLSDTPIPSDQLILEEPEMGEEAPIMTSEELSSGAIEAEEDVEPEFDYYGCEVCKTDGKPVDTSNIVFNHKCPICPCVCFCAHLLKEHMKVIHGWFNVQRRFQQF